MEKPKILYVSFDEIDAAKGAAIHIARFTEALQREYQVTVIVPGKHDEDRIQDWQQAQLYEFALPKKNFLDRVTIFRNKLAAHLTQHHYQAVQFRSIWEGEIVRRLSKKTVLLYEANGFPSIELKYHYPALLSHADFIDRLRMQELSALLAAKKIITPSNITRDFINSLGINSQKISVITNGADIDLFKPAPLNKESLLCPKDNADNVVQLIYVGTFAPWQGLSTLLRALRLVRGHIKVHLKIIGRSRREWLRHYRKLIADYRLNSIVSLHNGCSQTELVDHLQQTDIAIAPLAAIDRNLLQGCSPIKLFEYAACECAIVAADIPVVSDIFTHNQHALLYKPHSAIDLAHTIVKLAQDTALRKALGQAARQLIIKNYTWHHAQQQLLKLYQQLLS